MSDRADLINISSSWQTPMLGRCPKREGGNFVDLWAGDDPHPLSA